MLYPFAQKQDAKKSAPKRFYIQFHPNDWQSDVNLKMCSLAAHGLLIRLICEMHNSSEYGYLVVNGKALTLEDIQLLVGREPETVANAFTELKHWGVISQDERGAWYSRRMVDDHERYLEQRAYGHLGGNPKLSGSGETLDGGGVSGDLGENSEYGITGGVKGTDNGSPNPMATHLDLDLDLKLHSNNSINNLGSVSDAIVQCAHGGTFELPLVRIKGDAVVRIPASTYYKLEAFYREMQQPTVKVCEAMSGYAAWAATADKRQLAKSPDTLINALRNWLKRDRERSRKDMSVTRDLMDNKEKWPSQFRDLWNLYPRREQTAKAMGAWINLFPNGADMAEWAEITAGLERWKSSASWSNEGGQFIHLLSTWLLNRMWNEHPVKAPAPKSSERPVSSEFQSKPAASSGSVGAGLFRKARSF